MALNRVFGLLGDLPSITSLDLGSPRALPLYLPAVPPRGLPVLDPHYFLLPSNLQYMRHWTLKLPILTAGDSPLVYNLRERHTEEPIDNLSTLFPSLQVENLIFTDRDWAFLYGDIDTSKPQGPAAYIQPPKTYHACVLPTTFQLNSNAAAACRSKSAKAGPKNFR